METFEPIRTEILTDPTITDAEMKLIGYLATKPPWPGWVIRHADIARALNRKPNWVKENLARLRKRGIVSSQPRKSGKFLAQDIRFNREKVVMPPLAEILAGGKTSALVNTEGTIANTQASKKPRSAMAPKTVSGFSANGKSCAQQKAPPAFAGRTDEASAEEVRLANTKGSVRGNSANGNSANGEDPFRTRKQHYDRFEFQWEPHPCLLCGREAVEGSAFCDDPGCISTREGQ